MANSTWKTKWIRGRGGVPGRAAFSGMLLLACLGAGPAAPAQGALPDAPLAAKPTVPPLVDSAARERELAAIRILVDQSLFAAAEGRCRALLAADPRLPEAASLLGYALLREGKARESLSAYSAAATLRKPEAADLMAVAADYVLLGDYREALRWYTRVTEWTPNDALARYDRARAEFKLEMYPAALLDFQKTLALAPEDERAD